MNHVVNHVVSRTGRFGRARSAAVAMLAAVALTLVLTACGDDAGDVAVGSDASTTPAGAEGAESEDGESTEGEEATDDDGAPVDGEPTGFYVPGELPDGWRITFEQITNPWQELCPCETGIWRNAAGETIKTFTSEQQGEPEGPFQFQGETTVHRDIPGGYLSIDGGQVTADWFDGDLTRSIYAEGLDPTVVEEMAVSWTGDEALPAPDGFEMVWSGTTPPIVRRTEFFWRIFRDGDHGMVVHVEPWMYDEPFDPAVDYPGAEPVALENELALVQVPGWDEPRFEGLWPGGAYMTVATNYGEINSHALPLSREEILEVAGGFRPVSAEEWADYLADLYGPTATETCRPLLLKQRLADLLVGPDDPGADLGFENWEMNEGCRVPSPDEESETTDGSEEPPVDAPTAPTTSR